MMQESPVKLQADGPTAEAALELYDKMREKAAKDYDPNDFLYWVESGRDYNPEPDLGKIKAQVLALNFADDPVNPADLEGTERLVKTIPSARFVLVPEGPKTNGHLSLDNASLWAPYLAELLRKGMSEGRSQR
jgi:homoserine O-acetyltransferase